MKQSLRCFAKYSKETGKKMGEDKDVYRVNLTKTQRQGSAMALPFLLPYPSKLSRKPVSLSGLII